MARGRFRSGAVVCAQAGLWHSVVMPESAAEMYARVLAAAEGGRLPAPSMSGWEVFPWEAFDQIKGSYAVEWDDILPPVPEDVRRADLHAVATKLANWGGTARV